MENLFFILIGIFSVYVIWRQRDDFRPVKPYTFTNHKGEFEEKKAEFFEILKKSQQQKKFNYFALKNNFKDVFDSIHRINLESSVLSFTEYKEMIMDIQYFIDNQKEIEIANLGYLNGIENSYGFINNKINKITTIYYPIIQKVDMKEYFSYLEKYYKEFKPDDIAEKIGFVNSYKVYFIFKNIQYLYDREDITSNQFCKLNETLCNYLKKNIDVH